VPLDLFRARVTRAAPKNHGDYSLGGRGNLEHSRGAADQRRRECDVVLIGYRHAVVIAQELIILADVILRWGSRNRVGHGIRDRARPGIRERAREMDGGRPREGDWARGRPREGDWARGRPREGDWARDVRRTPDAPSLRRAVLHWLRGFQRRFICGEYSLPSLARGFSSAAGACCQPPLFDSRRYLTAAAI
jgi:hypothetical protein